MVALAADTTVTDPNSETGAYSAEVTVTTEVCVPTIKVTVPDSFEVEINPYKMEYEFTDNTTASDVLVNVEQTITNESDVAIDVIFSFSQVAATPEP